MAGSSYIHQISTSISGDHTLYSKWLLLLASCIVIIIIVTIRTRLLMLLDAVLVGWSFFQIHQMAVCIRLMSRKVWRSCHLQFLTWSIQRRVGVLMVDSCIQVGISSHSL